MNDRSRLEARTVLVTGGAGFLGQQWTTALLSAGADVICLDVVPTAQRPQSHERLRHEVADITDPTAIGALAARLAAEKVTVDVLVNNAALDAPVRGSGLADTGRLETLSLERWQTEIAVGLTGAFLCAQAFGPAMAARGYGVIVNVGSDLGLISPDQRLYAVEGLQPLRQPVKPITYPVIKAGLIGLTRYLATYWAAAGVRANVLCLGGVERDQDPAFLARLSERVPLARMAHTDEYGEAMIFLCSDASSYMTGSTMVVDGGRTAW